MALQREVWIQDIQENLFPTSMFFNKAVDHSAYVHYKTVHLPQAGGNPNVVIDRAVLPATINQRADTDWTYNLNQYTTDPILITNLDQYQISYQKRMSVVGQHLKLLNYSIGNYTAYKWAADCSGSSIIKTTGSAVGSALASGATGTRNAITLNDIAALAAKLDKDNVSPEGRYLLMPVDMYWNQFAQINNVQTAYSYGSAILPDGVIKSMFGFNIMVRPTTVTYDSSFAIKAVGAATATTDNMACIAWQQDEVSRAFGAMDVFSDSGDSGNGKPEYFGQILSASVFFGAKILRADQKGIAVLTQQ